MDLLPLLTVLSAVLSLSFLFWILVAYGSKRILRFGVCSVCGAVVSVWGANLFLGFLPGWVTLLLMGQSVTGGATLFRDTLLVPRRTKVDRRAKALSQVVWFGFILGGTFVLGLVGLVFALR